jgi:hypothetical protein
MISMQGTGVPCTVETTSPTSCSPPATPITSATVNDTNLVEHSADQAHHHRSRKPFGELSSFTHGNVPHPENNSLERRKEVLPAETETQQTSSRIMHVEGNSHVRQRLTEWERERQRLREMERLRELEQERNGRDDALTETWVVLDEIDKKRENDKVPTTPSGALSVLMLSFLS